MERTSFLYKIRRKGQVIAGKIMPNNIMSKLYYRIVLKEKLDLENPQTFNEKIQWCKLYYYPNDERVIKCTDKYAVREYIEKKGYKDILTPLLAVWDSTNDIEWEKLPDRFVLKCNHGCAYNIIVSDKNKSNKKKIFKQLNTWLKEDFGAFNIELHYSKIKTHKILCEKFLGDNITDYKFFCFNGCPKYIYVSNDLVHDRQAKIGFFYLDGTKMPMIRDDYIDIPEVIFPVYFSEMLEVAKKLSQTFHLYE